MCLQSKHKNLFAIGLDFLRYNFGMYSFHPTSTREFQKLSPPSNIPIYECQPNSFSYKSQPIGGGSLSVPLTRNCEKTLPCPRLRQGQAGRPLTPVSKLIASLQGQSPSTKGVGGAFGLITRMIMGLT